MKRQAKILLLRIAKTVGLFALLRRATKNQLRVLCYHGFSEVDEHEFRTKYFIKPSTFDARLDLIKAMGFSVIPLHEAVDALWKNQLPHNSVVITIDDGLVSVLKHAAPLLKRRGFPSTVYVTTYYVENQVPICGFAAQYLIWKAWKTRATGDENSPERRPLSESVQFHGLSANLSTVSGRDKLTEDVARLLDSQESDRSRQKILRQLEAQLLPGRGILDSRNFSLMSKAELIELSSFGMDIQLHTHRHTFPVDESLCQREITENTASLNSVAISPLVQFCYPSGVYDPIQIQWLKRLGIRSATTCDKGLVSNTSNPYLMDRILDGENVTPIEIEAELAGISVLLATLKARFTRINSHEIAP
jgi:peptidoglycan/xylan/chitin deacetylase (PgdA/CDA1 family)